MLTEGEREALFKEDASSSGNGQSDTWILDCKRSTSGHFALEASDLAGSSNSFVTCVACHELRAARRTEVPASPTRRRKPFLLTTWREVVYSEDANDIKARVPPRVALAP